MNTSVFFPLRAGSERIKNKNTRVFSIFDEQSLFEIKLDQLIAMADSFESVVISTNDQEVVKQTKRVIDLPKNFRIVPRPNELCSSSTKLQDVIDYVPTVCHGDHIMWIHATSPFVGTTEMKDALNEYKKNVIAGTFDSLMSVTEIQEFLWDAVERDALNWNREKTAWPRTQDLRKFYEINSAVFLAPRECYIEKRDRIGKRPFLFTIPKIKAFDIDSEEDFIIAQKLIM